MANWGIREATVGNRLRFLPAGPTLAWGFSHFDTMSKIVCRLLDGYNTSKVLFFWTVAPLLFTSLLPADPFSTGACCGSQRAFAGSAGPDDMSGVFKASGEAIGTSKG